MNITLTINGNKHEIESHPSETLLSAVRRLGYYGVKFGDEQGLSGADTVLIDGKPVNAGSMLAAQADGHFIVTIEGLGEHPDQGWKKTEGLHPLQQAFVESGAIQCGYHFKRELLFGDPVVVYIKWAIWVVGYSVVFTLATQLVVSPRLPAPPGICATCGYGLRWLPERRCPECGRPF